MASKTGGTLYGRVKGLEVMKADEQGVRPLKITVEHSSVVNGKAYVTKSQVVVDPKDIGRYPIGASVELEVASPQQDLPFTIAAGKAATAGKAN